MSDCQQERRHATLILDHLPQPVTSELQGLQLHVMDAVSSLFLVIWKLGGQTETHECLLMLAYFLIPLYFSDRPSLPYALCLQRALSIACGV